jgi:hypothetical protein
MEHLADWPIRSPEAFRNAMLGPMATCAINPMFGITEKEELDFMRDRVGNAIAEGRMIDFGFIPNELMKQESLKSRTMFEAGELQHPYGDWVATSTWEGGFNGYYFWVDPEDPRDTLCFELYGVAFPPPEAIDVVLIYDIIKIEAEGIGETHISAAKTLMEDYNTDNEQLELRGANCLDPLVTMLRLLADASVPIIDHPEPIKLNRRRVAQGKFPIPAHASVLTKDYVSSFHAAKNAKAPSKGGHHASPMAHWRRGHKRQLASGQVVPVRSSKVNWRNTETLHRLFYRVPK